MSRFASRTLSTDTAIFAKSVGPGIEAVSDKDCGVLGFHGDPKLNETTVASDAGKAGVFGASENGAGVLGYARDRNMPAVFAFGGLLAIALSKVFAAEFRGDVKVEGDVMVEGDIRLSGADCAEQFDVFGGVTPEPGSVVVIDRDGALRQSSEPYDTKVAGVISGAGTYRPGIILDKQPASSDRVSVSLIGKVFCKVDSDHGSIALGDLLTTSPTPGHAMKANDPTLAFGAVLGKALKPWNDGRGLIPILVALG
jgi:hypothetical protein